MSKESLCTVINKLYAAIDGKVFQQFGFHVREASLERIENYLYTPKDASSLAVTRILFGLAMLCDIPDERGGAALVQRWGGSTCHFPLLPFLRAAPLPYMALVYAALWLGALGMTLGYRYRLSATMFVLSYWYLLLVEKSYWNNHSYMFGLVGLLLALTDADCCWSIDAIKKPSVRRETVPYWNYFILKYQFFIVYFMAGLKKGSAEWLSGYSVQNLSEHWVFSPFRLFLTVPQTDYLVVHWFVFVFDLTVVVWMMWGRTRHVAMLFCALFNLMNSRLFSIGMFPWVCLAMMPLFYPFDWPKVIGLFLKTKYLNMKKKACKYLRIIQRLSKVRFDENISEDNGVIQTLTKLAFDQNISEGKGVIQTLTTESDVYDERVVDDKEECNELKKDIQKESAEEVSNGFKEEIYGHEKNLKETVQELDKKAIICNNDVKKCAADPKGSRDGSVRKNKYLRVATLTMISFLVLTQAFLPFSHFITKGYNNWTKGLYGYSWDMMVHTWDTSSVVVKIVDNDNVGEFYIDPHMYTPNDRWTRHGDMLYQYAHCIKDIFITEMKKDECRLKHALSNNLSIFVDVWCSLNGRFTQRMFDSKADLLSVSWSPLAPVSYLMPLLDEALAWRPSLQDMRRDVHSWHNATDVLFIADFPGYTQEKYIPNDLDNVTLTVLEGVVAYEPEMTTNFIGQSYQLNAGTKVMIDKGIFHKVVNIGKSPAYYMYTFANMSDVPQFVADAPPMLPIGKELSRRAQNMVTFAHVVVSNIFQLFFQLAQCQQVYCNIM